jgi:hypothetical protein
MIETVSDISIGETFGLVSGRYTTPTIVSNASSMYVVFFINQLFTSMTNKDKENGQKNATFFFGN